MKVIRHIFRYEIFQILDDIYFYFTFLVFFFYDLIETVDLSKYRTRPIKSVPTIFRMGYGVQEFSLWLECGHQSRLMWLTSHTKDSELKSNHFRRDFYVNFVSHDTDICLYDRLRDYYVRNNKFFDMNNWTLIIIVHCLESFHKTFRYR